MQGSGSLVYTAKMNPKVSLRKASRVELNQLHGQRTHQLPVLDLSARARQDLIANPPLLHEVRTCV